MRRPGAPARALLLGLLLLLVPVGAEAVPADAVATTPPEVLAFGSWAGDSCPAPDGAGGDGPERIVVHHSDTATPAQRDEVPVLLRAVCAGHVERGFATVGYHYAVDPWGRVWQLRGRQPDDDGRAPATQLEGAHVGGSNRGAVGVVLLGDHDAAPPTRAAMVATTELVAWLQAGAGHRPGEQVRAVSLGGGGSARFDGPFEVPRVAGHSDTNHTLCPGAYLEGLLPDLRARVREVLDGQPRTPWIDLAAAPDVPPPAGVAVPDAGATGQPAARSAVLALLLTGALALATTVQRRRGGRD